MQAFIGVDVGTASARAGIFDATGALLAVARHPLATWKEPGDIVEQSSADIWSACAQAVRVALQEAGLGPDAIGGIGFDATCSLVVVDPAGGPLAVGPSGDPARNVIVWMDHRASAESREISATGHPVLRHVGDVASPEMQLPKLLWLKRRLPGTYAAAGSFFDLADYLSFRATGSTSRSLCTVTCKWNYLAHERRWDDGFFERIGLAELSADGHARIGRRILPQGTALAHGLTAGAAAELGLAAGTPVGASLIDAHAGGLGTIGGGSGRLACVIGTSACIMASTAEPHFIPGLWGPFFSGMVPGRWLVEGGQSAAGSGIDWLIRSHPAWPKAMAAADAAGLGLVEFLERRILAGSSHPAQAAWLARDLHVLPEFLGNRSPHADPATRAMIAGLDLDESLESLERLFVAGLCGLAYGLSEVMDAMRAHGIACGSLVASGGGGRSALLRQVIADTTGTPVFLPATPEPVLLGAAMLGAVAGGSYAGLEAAIPAMSACGAATAPSTAEVRGLHAAKKRVYTAMRRMERESRAAMAAVTARS